MPNNETVGKRRTDPRKCIQCGMEFRPRPTDRMTRKCCSVACGNASRRVVRTVEEQRAIYRKKSRDWYHKNLSRGRALARKGNLKRHYGLSEEDRDKLFAKGCEICGTTIDLCVDHDHQTGAVRGALCGIHNRGIGNFQDDPIMLYRAITYLQHKAAQVA